MIVLFARQYVTTFPCSLSATRVTFHNKMISKSSLTGPKRSIGLFYFNLVATSFEIVPLLGMHTTLPASLLCLISTAEVLVLKLSDAACFSVWISSTVLKRRPLHIQFHSGESWSTWGAISGEYRRCGMCCVVLREVWVCTLSWCNSSCDYATFPVFFVAHLLSSATEHCSKSQNSSLKCLRTLH